MTTNNISYVFLSRTNAISDMKTIKTASGIKKIEACMESVVLIKVREILMDHRSVLISRLIADLSTYVEYKFKTKLNKETEQAIADKLTTLKHSLIDIDRYDPIIQTILQSEKSYVNSEPFYKELDEVIQWYVRPSQMVLMK
jgi:hypothetical protein